MDPAKLKLRKGGGMAQTPAMCVVGEYNSCRNRAAGGEGGELLRNDGRKTLGLCLLCGSMSWGKGEKGEADGRDDKRIRRPAHAVERLRTVLCTY